MKVNKIGSSRVFSAAVSGGFGNMIVLRFSDTTSYSMLYLRTSGVVKTSYTLNGEKRKDTLQNDYSGYLALTTDPGSVVTFFGDVIELDETNSSADNNIIFADYSKCRTIEHIDTVSRRTISDYSNYQIVVIKRNSQLKYLRLAGFRESEIDLSQSISLESITFQQSAQATSCLNVVNIPSSATSIDLRSCKMKGLVIPNDTNSNSIQILNVETEVLPIIDLSGNNHVSNFSFSGEAEKIDIIGAPSLTEIDIRQSVSTIINIKNNPSIKRFYVPGTVTGSVDLSDANLIEDIEILSSNLREFRITGDKPKLKELQTRNTIEDCYIDITATSLVKVWLLASISIDRPRRVVCTNSSTLLYADLRNNSLSYADFNGAVNLTSLNVGTTKEVKLNGTKYAVNSTEGVSFARGISSMPSGGTIYVNAGETALTTGEAATLLTNKGWTVVEE